MIDNFALKIATWIKNTNPDQTRSVEVMRFALNVIFNTVSIIVLSIIVGVITGNLKATVQVMVAFAALRAFSGGIHIKKSEICILVSTSMIILLGALSNLIDYSTSVIFTMIALVIILTYAPAIKKNQTRISEEHYPLLKVISGTLVALNFIIGSPAMALALLAQAITLVIFKYWKGGENK